MASITIRNLEDDLKCRLRIRAAGHGHSMEEEVRIILRKEFERPETNDNLVELIRKRFAWYGDVELPIPAREAISEPPDFSDVPGRDE